MSKLPPSNAPSAVGWLARPQAGWHALRRQFDRQTALLYAAHRLLGVMSGGRVQIVPYALFAQPLASPALHGLKPDEKTVVRLCLADDPLVRAFPRPGAVLADRWRAGALCFSATVKDDFAGHIWISENFHDEDEVRCRFHLPADGVWDFDVFVVPRMRLGRTMARLWAGVGAHLCSKGHRWSYSRISRFNNASLQAHERLGAREVARATFIKLGALQLAWLPGHWWPTAGWRSRPVIHLQSPGES
ncbi:MAG: hypothetical protein QE285_20195 [Aquabacterium sp.]|nr:hypothetical protein [Aquabacterium sp.]